MDPVSEAGNLWIGGGRAGGVAPPPRLLEQCGIGCPAPCEQNKSPYGYPPGYPGYPPPAPGYPPPVPGYPPAPGYPPPAPGYPPHPGQPPNPPPAPGYPPYPPHPGQAPYYPPYPPPAQPYYGQPHPPTPHGSHGGAAMGAVVGGAVGYAVGHGQVSQQAVRAGSAVTFLALCVCGWPLPPPQTPKMIAPTCRETWVCVLCSTTSSSTTSSRARGGAGASRAEGGAAAGGVPCVAFGQCRSNSVSVHGSRRSIGL